MRHHIISCLSKAILACSGKIFKSINLDIPRDKRFGDLSTNVSLRLAKELCISHKDASNRVVSNLSISPNIIEKVEIAENGFINFFFSKSYLISNLKQILEKKDLYGTNTRFKGKTALVEFVSANPTGPLTVGRGRGGILGDVLANILSTQGYKVTREYYFNNAGRQINILADSVRLRYLSISGKNISFPDNYYQGSYIYDIARNLYKEYKDSKVHSPTLPFFKTYAESVIFDSIKKTLKKLRINHDSFFNETDVCISSDPSKKSKIEVVIDQLDQKGYISKHDGSTWFLTTKLGQEKDKVLIKSTGEPTYRLPDIAYHIEKFSRGYDEMVNVLGADHIDEYPDILYALKILNYDTSKVRVAINQFVTTSKDGIVKKISTRKGSLELLDNLVEEVGVDATRFFFLMRRKESHLNFDISLAKDKSVRNPVFYLQYAHARICSILTLVNETLASSDDQSVTYENLPLQELEHLSTNVELELAKSLLMYPDTLSFSEETLEPQKLITYLRNLTECFHKFYETCRIIGESSPTIKSRTLLCLAVRQVLRNALSVLNISAPTSM